MRSYSLLHTLCFCHLPVRKSSGERGCRKGNCVEINPGGWERWQRGVWYRARRWRMERLPVLPLDITSALNKFENSEEYCEWAALASFGRSACYCHGAFTLTMFDHLLRAKEKWLFKYSNSNSCLSFPLVYIVSGKITSISMWGEPTHSALIGAHPGKC